MADEEFIVSSPEMLDGRACIKGTRLSVELLLELMAQGATQEQILAEHDQFTPEGLKAALRYAAGVVKNDSTRC